MGDNELILQALSAVQADINELKGDTKEIQRTVSRLDVSNGRAEERLANLEKLAEEAKKIAIDGHSDACPLRGFHSPPENRNQTGQQNEVSVSVGNNNPGFLDGKKEDNAKNYFWIVFGTISALTALLSILINIITGFGG